MGMMIASPWSCVARELASNIVQYRYSAALFPGLIPSRVDKAFLDFVYYLVKEIDYSFDARICQSALGDKLRLLR